MTSSIEVRIIDCLQQMNTPEHLTVISVLNNENSRIVGIEGGHLSVTSCVKVKAALNLPVYSLGGVKPTGGRGIGPPRECRNSV